MSEEIVTASVKMSKNIKGTKKLLKEIIIFIGFGSLLLLHSKRFCNKHNICNSVEKARQWEANR